MWIKGYPAYTRHVRAWLALEGRRDGFVHCELVAQREDLGERAFMVLGCERKFLKESQLLDKEHRLNGH